MLGLVEIVSVAAIVRNSIAVSQQSAAIVGIAAGVITALLLRSCCRSSSSHGCSTACECRWPGRASACCSTSHSWPQRRLEVGAHVRWRDGADPRLPASTRTAERVTPLLGARRCVDSSVKRPWFLLACISGSDFSTAFSLVLGRFCDRAASARRLRSGRARCARARAAPGFAAAGPRRSAQSAAFEPTGCMRMSTSLRGASARRRGAVHSFRSAP